MTEDQTAQLLRQTTTDLTPDVDGLVRRGVARGRTLRRRRRVGASLATVAVFGVIGTVAGVGSDVLVDDGGAAPVAADPSASVTDTASTASAPPEPTASERPRAVRPGVRAPAIPGLVTAIVPGEVTAAAERTGRYLDRGDDGQIAHFLLDGTLVSAGVVELEEEPLTRCRSSSQGDGSECAAQPDGSVLARFEATGPEVDGAVSSRGVSRYLPGWEVFVMSYNAADGKDSAVLTPTPPIGYAELEEIALAEGWFSDGS